MNHRMCTNSPATQRGAALLIMMVIMVLGIATVLVGSLNSSAINIKRQQQTSAALAQAKDALIGRAAADANVPGSLPCPDSNDDGSAELMVGNDCPHYIGRLPWRTLGLTELRDGSGEHLWYALSRNFRDDSTAHLNSDTSGTLNINGTQSVNNVVAIVLAAGNPLPGQNRSPTQIASCSTLNSAIAASLCANNYLEGGNNNLSSAAVPNTSYQAGAPTSALNNDQLLAITREQLLPPVEMRIAREAKACLDNYAATNGQRYPWAVDPTDVSFYYSKQNTLFGRVPKHRVPDNDVQNLINAMNAFQLVVSNCANNMGNQVQLIAMGIALENASDQVKNNQPTTPAITTSVTSPAKTAGDLAKDLTVACSDIRNDPNGNAIQVNLNNTITALSTLPPSFPWPASCALITANYWTDWRNYIYYQLASDYSPSGALNVPSITINGKGAYRAAVIAARSPIGAQVRNPAVPNSYLEGTNVHTNPNPNTAFIFNSVSDANYRIVNDLVLCLDAQVNCK